MNRALLDELLLVKALCSFIGDKLAVGTLRNTLRYGRISKLLRVHLAGGLARPGRFGRREGRTLRRLLLKLKWTTLFSYRLFEGKHVNLLELESLISLLRRVTRGGVRGRRLLVLLDSRVVLGSRLKRTIDLTKNQLLASKAKVLVPRL